MIPPENIALYSSSKAKNMEIINEKLKISSGIIGCMYEPVPVSIIDPAEVTFIHLQHQSSELLPEQTAETTKCVCLHFHADASEYVFLELYVLYLLILRIPFRPISRIQF